MRYKLLTDEQILDLSFRQKIIKEITESENTTRKAEAQKRHEIYKDNTRKWVIESLAREGLKQATLETMANRAANISVCKKVIDKLARCYVGGVQRTATPESAQPQVDNLAKLLELNTKNKKADRFRELFKNTVVQPIPVKNVIESERAGIDKFDLEYRVYAPWQYDVIEDYYDKERPRVVILSDYKPVHAIQMAAVDSMSTIGAHVNTAILGSTRAEGNGINEVIADDPYDSQYRVHIWWSHKYHFTTDCNGIILKDQSPDDLLNPIQMLPFCNVAQDQDGEFWAKGGDDLIDGSVLINLVMTDVLHIAYTQGYGQLVVTGGPDIPDTIDIGTMSAIVLRRKDASDPEPKVDYAQANPPLEMHMKSLEQYVALLLSTNGLSPTNVANAIDASQFPSGISLLIEQSEVSGKIEDKQEIMSHVEHDTFEIIKSWQNYLFDKGALTDAFQKIGALPDDLSITVRFNTQKPVITEKEKLENLKTRIDLGINEKVDLIMMDNPDMTREDAEKKLLAIQSEKLKNTVLYSIAQEKDEPATEEPALDTQQDEEQIGQVGT